MSGLVQGMGRVPVAPDWPAITVEEACDVLAAWGLAGGAVCWRSPRPFSAAALVAVPGDGTVFLKRHDRRVRTAAALEAEHGFARHLAAHGQPVPEVLDRPGGASALEVGPWAYELHRAAAGDDRYRNSLAWTPYAGTDDARSAGAALARFHDAARDWSGPPPQLGPLTGGSRVATADDPFAAVGALVAARPTLRRWLVERDWRRELGPLLEPWAPVPAGTGWGHGDWHPTNLMWSGSAVAGVVDLGLAAPTGAPFDVAVALERAAVGWLDLAEGRPPTVDRAGAWAFLDGYRSVAALDVEAVARSLPLAHVDFALSELEYFAGVTGSDANATLAWDGYLCGHLRWWDAPAGRVLLEEVKGRDAR